MGDRKDIQPVKNPVQLIPKGSLLKQAQEESERKPRFTQGTAIKQRLVGNRFLEACVEMYPFSSILTRMWADAQCDGHPPNIGGALC